jgi:hypothetical protein
MKKVLILAAICSATVSVAAEAATVNNIIVFAKENSTNLLNTTNPSLPEGPQVKSTGVILDVGDSFGVSASGSWSLDAPGFFGPINFYGPNGTNQYGSTTIGGSAVNFGTLVGRIGTGPYFKVGSVFSGVATASGELFLAFLDNDFYNNGGFVTASVTYPDPDDQVPAVPLPAGMWLGLTGIAALVAARRRTA